MTNLSENIGPNNFEILKILGKGMFGKVVQVKEIQSGEILAMKIISKKKMIKHGHPEHAISENIVLKLTRNHPFCVHLKYAFQNDEKLYLVTEFLPGGDLFSLIEIYGILPENAVRFYLAELVLAVEFLHKYNIIHRDIKPENMLIDDRGHLRLVDFGLCKQVEMKNEMTKTWCSTSEYMAPEMLDGKGYNCGVDWYQLGLCTYELLVGQIPFYDPKTTRMYNNILKATLDIPDSVSKSAQSLIRGLLERDPIKRMGNSASDAQEIKEHPFFSSINWQKVVNLEYNPPFIPSPRDCQNENFNGEDKNSNIDLESCSQHNNYKSLYYEDYYFNHKQDQSPQTETCSCI